jgi:uncharacterized radical SAM superfamily Fe-S cluster-containing enzyme
LKKFFDARQAPKGMTWNRFLQSLDGYRDKKFCRREGWQEYCFPTVFVAGMHFMDHYNYDVERVKRCLVHYSCQDGKIYPFCTLNAGPYFRAQLENKYQIPLAEYKAKLREGPVSPSTGRA